MIWMVAAALKAGVVVQVDVLEPKRREEDEGSEDFAGAAGVVAILGCGAGCRAESGRKAGVDDGEDCADWGAACCAPTTDAWALPNRFAAGRSVEFEGRDMDWGAIRSGIWGLWELPTTQETPGRVASSSGARWA